MPSTPRSSHSGDFQASPLKTRILSCRLCHRQIGLWSIFIPCSPDTDTDPARPPVHLVGSHRDYCPYRDQWAGFDPSDYQIFDPHCPELLWHTQFMLIRRFAERHQLASQVATQPNCLDNLMKTFLDSDENLPGPTRSIADTNIRAVEFVRGTLSKCVRSA